MQPTYVDNILLQHSNKHLVLWVPRTQQRDSTPRTRRLPYADTLHCHVNTARILHYRRTVIPVYYHMGVAIAYSVYRHPKKLRQHTRARLGALAVPVRRRKTYTTCKLVGDIPLTFGSH